MGKRIQQLLLAIPFLFFGVGSYGSNYFSYVEEVESLSKHENIYHFVMEYWKESSPYEGNPCQSVLGSKGAKNCYFTINHLHKGNDVGGVASRAAWSCGLNFATYTSMSAIIRDSKAGCGLSFPLTGSSQHSGAITTDECVGIFLTTSKGAQGKMLPGGICGIAPPPAGKCFFTSLAGGGNTLELNHGSLNADELNGDVETGLFYIQCNQDMSVKVSSNLQQDNVYLRPNGELQSYVTLNNQSAARGLVQSVKANQVWPVQVASTLKTNGAVAPGKFSGRITLVLTIP